MIPTGSVKRVLRFLALSRAHDNRAQGATPGRGLMRGKRAHEKLLLLVSH